jgi:hypothetical protein
MNNAITKEKPLVRPKTDSQPEFSDLLAEVAVWLRTHGFDSQSDRLIAYLARWSDRDGVRYRSWEHLPEEALRQLLDHLKTLTINIGR